MYSYNPYEPFATTNLQGSAGGTRRPRFSRSLGPWSRALAMVKALVSPGISGVWSGVFYIRRAIFSWGSTLFFFSVLGVFCLISVSLSASLIACLLFLLLCFYSSLLLCFFASLLLHCAASLLLRFSAFPCISLLFCFSSFSAFCLSASPCFFAYLLFCLPASLLFPLYFCFSNCRCSVRNIIQIN